MQKNNDEKIPKRAQWRIRDILDLEYFLQADDSGEDAAEAPAPSPREIYLSRLQPLAKNGAPTPRRTLLKGWLDERRKHRDASLPGEIYHEISRVGMVLAIVLGLMAGGGLAASLLHYSGDRPLNVSIYLGVGVFSQLLLLTVLLVVFVYRASHRRLLQNSVLAKLLGRMLIAVFHKAKSQTLKKTPGRTREGLAAAAGLFRGRQRVYGSLFFWPVFITLQLFGVSFNLGLLGTTLMRLAGSDAAFGWQSTFQVSVPVVYRIVEIFALPWRWMVPLAVAHPTLEQIEGSRIILKEGIYRLATGDLVSWWPFLCLSVLFYGLLPRLILLSTGTCYLRHLLAKLRFDHGDCDQLFRRMLTPAVQTAGMPAAGSNPENETVAVPPPVEEAPGAAAEEGEMVALVPEELFELSGGIEASVVTVLGMKVAEKKKIGVGVQEDQQILDAFSGNARPSGGVVMLQEAWQPPIRETQFFLKELRKHLGERARIVVGLIGKPDPDTIFTKVREEDFQIWKRGVNALGDPYLRVERLGGHG